MPEKKRDSKEKKKKREVKKKEKSKSEDIKLDFSIMSNTEDIKSN